MHKLQPVQPKLISSEPYLGLSNIPHVAEMIYLGIP